MAKLSVYEFVFAQADGTHSRVHTVRSGSWREAIKAIQRHNTKDELVAFQLADPRRYSLSGANAVKDAVVEHPIEPVIKALSAEPD